MALPAKKSRPVSLSIDESLTDLTRDASAAKSQTHKDASAIKPKDNDSEVGPQVSVATDPDANGTSPAVTNIYNLVAIKMNTDIMDRNGPWELPCKLTGHDFISFIREQLESVTEVCATALSKVAKAAGGGQQEINTIHEDQKMVSGRSCVKGGNGPRFPCVGEEIREGFEGLQYDPRKNARVAMARNRTHYVLVGL